MTPLRQRMTDAMLQRGYATSTQANYVKAIHGMTKYYRRDPAQYNAAEVQAYLNEKDFPVASGHILPQSETWYPTGSLNLSKD